MTTLKSNRVRQVAIYTPESSLRNPAQLMGTMFRDLWRGRELAWRLAVRDISAQYRQTALGLMWAFVLPLTNSMVWIFLNISGVVNIQGTPLPYPVYVFTGTVVWSIFIDAANAPLQQTTAAKLMLAKINFPREALIVSGIYQTLFNATIKIAVLLPTIILLGVYPNWNILLFPVALLSLVLAGTAIGLLLTPVGMLYSDIGKAFPLAMQFLMFLTPVVFATPTSGWGLTIFQANPLTPLIQTARDWLTATPPEFMFHFMAVNCVMAALLFAMWIVYRAAMPILIERMSA